MDGRMDVRDDGWMGEGTVPLRQRLPSPTHMIPPTHTPNLSAWLRILDHRSRKAPVFSYTAVLQEIQMVAENEDVLY